MAEDITESGHIDENGEERLNFDINSPRNSTTTSPDSACIISEGRDTSTDTAGGDSGGGRVMEFFDQSSKGAESETGSEGSPRMQDNKEDSDSRHFVTISPSLSLGEQVLDTG